MSLTDKDAFKLGFLARCAEEKLCGEALDQRLAAVESWINLPAAEKEAAGGAPARPWFNYSPIDWGSSTLSNLGSALRGGAGVITTGGTMALAAPFVAVPAATALAGYGTAKMIEPTVSDEDVKAQELAATYKLYAEKAKARRKARKYRLENNGEY